MSQELSKHERDVLQMTWDDMTSRQISLAKGMSMQWVQKRYQSIYCKLGAYSRVGMLRMALKKGIIEL